jgi:nitroreductase
VETVPQIIRINKIFVMNRNKFLGIAAGTFVMAGAVNKLIGSNAIENGGSGNGKPIETSLLDPIETEILHLASLAPSGHNAQPWFVKYIKPYHWIICNDKTKWLPAVDPEQRETILSIGAFIQNLEFAANNAGFSCEIHVLATSNQDENIVEVVLIKSRFVNIYNISKIKSRRVVRDNFQNDPLKKEDIKALFNEEKESFHYIPNGTDKYQYLNEQTIAANKVQAYRDPAEKELSEWIRFSKKDGLKYRDGLTTASMGIEGMAGWIVRHFYNKSSVMKTDFREKTIKNTVKQVSQSAGWLVITSKDNKVASLLETGKRMQKMFLKVRDKDIAIHPMSQILEEPDIKMELNNAIGVKEEVQFLLRMGYMKKYPDTVSFRRPVNWFVKT